MTAPANNLPGRKSIPLAVGNHEARIRALERLSVVQAAVVPIKACMLEFPAQVFATSTTTFTVINLDKIRVSDTDYFTQADTSAYPNGVEILKQGLYYVEARITEVTQTGIGSHDPSGFPRDLVIDWPNTTPVEWSGEGMKISTTNFYAQESAESTFVGWKSGVNASANPPAPGVGNLREIETIRREWFSLNQDEPTGDVVLRLAYRQASGFNQTTTAKGAGIIVHVTSDMDTMEFSDLTVFNY